MIEIGPKLGTPNSEAIRRQSASGVGSCHGIWWNPSSVAWWITQCQSLLYTEKRDVYITL